MQIQLPKLKKVDFNRSKKKKIFLLSDDLRFSSGIATMSKELILGTCHEYDWVQLAAALQHPEHGKVIDLSQEIAKETGVHDCSVKQYCCTGYGSQDIIREVIMYEKPDAIMIFTDPRFWTHVFLMEDELKTHYKIPLLYLNIWDSPGFPFHNSSAYESCDLLMNISRQTQALVRGVLGKEKYFDLDTNEGNGKILLSKVTHGINPKYFFPITSDHSDYSEFKAFELDFKTKNNCDFIVFWNNRNVRRKQPGDVILAYRKFCDSLPKEKANKCCLFMKTSVLDENGTDLNAVKNAICPNYRIVFSQELLHARIMNFFYNLADVTINIASNEGFGLSNAESQMAGTITIQNVTGGLQDQCRFEDNAGKWLEFNEDFTSNHAKSYEKHGPWCFPIFPSNRSLQGSIPTPYIFDDRCKFEDVAEKLLEIYNIPKEERKRLGKEGNKWMLSDESGMSSGEMCKKFIQSTQKLFETWKPKSKYEFIKIEPKQQIMNPGIVWE